MTPGDPTGAAGAPAALRVAIAPAPTDAEAAALVVALLALLDPPIEPSAAETPTPWRIAARREAVFGRRGGDSAGWGRPRLGARS